jgi:hypothetical protein
MGSTMLPVPAVSYSISWRTFMFRLMDANFKFDLPPEIFLELEAPLSAGHLGPASEHVVHPY